MNINFIGKEFERLAWLEDCINYEYEPKTNLKYGKRNIYFDDIKLDFINEVNTYGFSPFILESFIEQRDDPNIMRFITKKFNHGLTNYIKVQNKGLIFHSNKNKKKLYNHNSAINLKAINKKNNQKKEKLISNIFLIKKNEDIKKNEEKEFFLQKALGGMGGHKLNISTEEDKDKEKYKVKENKNNIDNNKNNKISKDNNEKNNNIELIKKLLNSPDKNNKNKHNNKLANINILPGVNNFNCDDFKQGNLKSFLDKLNISTEEDKDKDKYKVKDNKNIIDNNKNKNNSKDKNEEKNNIELLKKIFIGPDKNKKNNNNKLENINILPGVNNFNYDDFKQGNLKSFLDKINKLPINSQNYEYNYDKKILTLSKNKHILGNKRIFSPISKNNFKSLDALTTFRKGKTMTRNYSMNIIKNNRTKNKFGIKFPNKKKDIFLLFAKARPYRYMENKANYIKEKENKNSKSN